MPLLPFLLFLPGKVLGVIIGITVAVAGTGAFWLTLFPNGADDAPPARCGGTETTALLRVAQQSTNHQLAIN